MNDYNARAMQAPAGLATPPGQPNKLTSPFYPGGGDFGMKPGQPGLIGRAMNPQPAPGGGFMPDERGFNLYAPPAKPNMYQAGNPNQVGSAAWAQAQALAKKNQPAPAIDVNSPAARQARWDNYARTMPQPQPAPQPMQQNTGFDPYAMARQQLVAKQQDLNAQQRNNQMQAQQLYGGIASQTFDKTQALQQSQRRGFGGDYTQPYYGPKAGF